MQKPPIKLMKSTFFHEGIMKAKLLEFIKNAEVLSMNGCCFKAESDFAGFHGTADAVMFNSGSSANLALIQALLNGGYLKRGDKVAFSALTWSTNVMPLFQLGLIPIPVDPEVNTLNVSSRTFLKTLETIKDIKALFISNILGFCEDLDVLCEICEQRGIIFLEDNCESFGSVYKGKKLGSFGMASTLSTYVGHHLSTIEGGFVFTSDEELAVMLRIVRAHGWDRSLSPEKQIKIRAQNQIDSFFDRYTFYDLGYNLRPTEISGFLAFEQLKHAEEIIKLRETNFHDFHTSTLKNPSIIHLKTDHIERISNFAFPVVFGDQKAFEYYKTAFMEENIEIRPIVGGNMTKQPFYKKYDTRQWNLPNSNLIHEQGFYFPNNPELTDEEKRRIKRVIEKG